MFWPVTNDESGEARNSSAEARSWTSPGWRAGVRKMTGEPADRCRLAGRGYLRPGYAADLAIFATDEVRDTAAFAASNQLTASIDHVLVNGVEVVSEGAWNGRVAGRVLRRGEPG